MMRARHKNRAGRNAIAFGYGVVIAITVALLVSSCSTAPGAERETVDEILASQPEMRRACIKPRDLPLRCPRGLVPEYQLWMGCVLTMPKCKRLP